MTHLALLHHFTTSLGPSMGRGSFLLKLWTITIPQIALTHEFLMHSLLAVAALHMAHIKADQQESHREQAIAHQSRALKLAHTEMGHPSAANADALFAFSIPTMWYSFASHVLPDATHESRPLAGVVQSINLLRGIKTVGPSVKQWIEQGPLAPLHKFGPENYKAAKDFADSNTSVHFSKLLVFCSTIGDSEMEDVEAFAAAASSLRASFLKVEAVADGEPSSPPIFHWAIRLPSNFVNRLADLHVAPLILVAHWCVLLKNADHFWWMTGWIEKTMMEIQACLSKDYEDWLIWPQERLLQMKPGP